MKKLSASLLSFQLFLASAGGVFAQQTIEQDKLSISEPPGFINVTPGTAITFLLMAIFTVAVIIALFFLVYGGIRWITSGGDQEKVEAARNTIVAAIIGLVVVVASIVILNFVLQILGIGSITNLNIPTLSDSS